MKNGNIYLAHIVDATEKIKFYTADKDFESFINDTELQDAVIRNLEIIGEASRRLPDSIKASINLPWEEISAMRNRIVHDYFEVNLKIIWKTATADILEVEKALSQHRPE